MIDRRLLIGLISTAVAAPAAFSQQAGPPVLKRARTNILEIAYEDSGPETGFPVLLMHGFPYDPRAFDDVVPPLVAAGYRAIVPYLRGYGQTRFLEADTPRSGQQAALGRDLVELMDALALPSAVLAGFDWGGRAACVTAALWPERVRGLVSANGYNIQDIAGSVVPAPPQQEHRLWYQYYFHTETRPCGPADQPARVMQAVVAAMVAELEIRRRHLRPHGGFLRQPGFRRRGHPLLPPSVRLRTGRSGL